MSAVVPGWFPGLKGLPAGASKDLSQPYLELIASEPNMIREIFGAIRKPWMPEPAQLDERWAYFRWTQVRLAGGVEYIRRYGDRNETVRGNRIANFFLDLDYLIPALLVDGLASCDSEMRTLYSVLGPDKLLLGCR